MPESYWDHIAAAYRDISIYDGPQVLAEGLKRFPSYVGDLFAAHWFLSEMSNGGISQFFANPTAVVAEHAVQAFLNFGLHEVAEALRKSIAKAQRSSDIPPPALFRDEERLIYTVGGDDLGRIYERMDAYAKEKKG